jgi:hypothetical protein
MRAPLESPLRYGEPATAVNSPPWVEYFNKQSGGYSGTVITAALTPTGTTGQMVFVDGRVMSVVEAT